MSLPLQEIATRQIAATTEKIYTYEDYRKLPEGAPYQLIGGMLIITPSPSTYHQIISMKLGFLLVSFVQEKNLGLTLFAPIDVYLNETNTYQPDILFIAKDRQAIIEPDKINGAPDLVIEILSPSTAYYDLRKKFKVYEKSGVKEYWIIDPEEQSVEVFTLQEGKFMIGQKAEKQGHIQSAIVEGFNVPIETIFA